MLVASNFNCTDTIVKTIPVQSFRDLLQLQFANVFTPNGDGINDLFDLGFNGEFIGCANFKVYDRSGSRVFDTNIGAYGWDGRSLRGELCPSGVYFYVIRLGDEIIKGSVLLTR
jgi:gliding motility-associated-like protein